MMSTGDSSLEMSDALASVRRWQDSGGAWRVVSRTSSSVGVALLTCDACEEMGRVSSDAVDLIRFVGSRSSSEESAP